MVPQPRSEHPAILRNYLSCSFWGRWSGPQSGKRGPINVPRPKSLLDPKPREPAPPSHLRRFESPRGAPPPHSPSPLRGPALQGRRLAPAGPACLGRGPGGDGPTSHSACRPAPRRGPGQTGGGSSPEGPVGTGTRRQVERASEEEPTGRRRAPPASGFRSRSVF